jgi:hypothetical protein
VYPSAAPAQGAKNRTREFATREGRKAYADAHRCIPPQLLPPAERKRRHAIEVEGEEHERRTPWLVSEIIFPMVVRNSQRALGYCNATEYTLRLWAWIDTGHLYGERSISRRLRLEARRGRLHRRIIPRDRPFKNGTRTRGGTTATWFPSERERRERLWREKIERRRRKQEAKKRRRAERVIARESKSAPADIEPPRVANAALVEREVKCELPSILRDVVVRPELLAEAEREARAAEVARQLEAFKEAFAADLAAEARSRRPPD